MNKSEILQAILAILEKDFEINAVCNADTSLVEEEILDSMDWIGFLGKIEEKFQIIISIEDTNKYQLAIIQNLVDYLQRSIDV